MQLEELPLFVASSTKGAVYVKFVLDKKQHCLGFFKARFPKDHVTEDYAPNLPLIQWVEAAFDGLTPEAPPDLDVESTPFQLKVYQAIAQIPFGETRTYGQVAAMVGKPRGARAIGQAMGANPLPIIYP
jgi:O6-methylguanine-DNA--protein-cysteine methyltransferase